MGPEQHIFWLDIAMDEFSVVGVLQGCRDLLDIGNDAYWQEWSAFGMAFAKRAVWSVVHDHKGDVVLYTKFQDADNVGVYKAGDSLRFDEELLHILANQAYGKHFDSSFGLQVNMFAEVDIGEAALSQ